MPLYYEYADDGVDMTKVPSSVKGTYVKKMKNIFDLYIKDSTVEPSSLSGKTMDDSIAEFATGQAVFFQDGVWAYNQIKGQSVSDNDLGVFPIYIGAKGEENQGLNQVISNYWCVNSKVSEKDQQATEKFLSWLVTSDTALKAISPGTWDWCLRSRASTTRSTKLPIRWWASIVNTRRPERPM